MPQNLLQIALEHHRAGRLRQAQAGYNAALAADAGNAEAMHWLGVLAFQAGQTAAAIAMLEQATALEPGDAAYQFNLGQAYLSASQWEDAIYAFRMAVALNPERAESLTSLGTAHLMRSAPGDAEAAVTAFLQARSTGLASAELHQGLGLALLGADRGQAAVEAFGAALAINPHDAIAHYNLAAAHRTLDQPKEVRKALLKSLELDPRSAQAWYALAMLDMEAGNLPQAAALFGRAIAAQPDYALAHQGLGHTLERQGKLKESLQAYRKAIQASRAKTIDPPARTVTAALAEAEQRLTPAARMADMHYALATRRNIFSPPRVPTWAIADLFDQYSENFDEHLVQGLQYHLPELIAQTVAKFQRGQPLDILDLGCGTGMCGAALRPMAATLRGVDLSPKMIEKARDRGVYDRLEVNDMVESLKAFSSVFDLVVAADVLIYTGDLSPTMEGAFNALRPGGRMVFSVESGPGSESGRYHMVQRSRRFTHSTSYLRRLITIYGFTEESFEPVIARLESTKPVPGFLLVLRKPPA